MRPTLWLAGLLDLEGDVPEDEVAAKLAAKLRLQPPQGDAGRAVLVQFAQQAELLYHRPDDLVRAAITAARADQAAADLGLRNASDLERVIRLAARDLWIWLAPQGPPDKRRPSSPRNRSPERDEDARLEALAAQAIAEARGEAPPAAAAAPPAATGTPSAPAPPGNTPATPEARLEALAAAAITEARGKAEREATAPAVPPPAAVVPPERPETIGAQLAAAGPLIAFLASVGATTIFVMIAWLVATAFGLV